MKSSTKLTWLWSFLFGPIYFMWHRFWGYAFLLFVLNLLLVGFVVSPFLAYKAWRERDAGLTNA